MLNLNFIPFPVLRTERLVLRELNMQDDNEMFFLRSDDKVNQYIDRPKVTVIEETHAFISKISNGIANNEWIFWAIELKNSDKLIGTICLWNISKEEASAEIGFELHPEQQGKGIMQEATAKVIEFGFSVMQLRKIDAWINKENLSSIKLIGKFNFKRDTDLENKFIGMPELENMVIYSLSNPTT